jgi:hypothetical protein
MDTSISAALGVQSLERLMEYSTHHEYFALFSLQTAYCPLPTTNCLLFTALSKPIRWPVLIFPPDNT